MENFQVEFYCLPERTEDQFFIDTRVKQIIGKRPYLGYRLIKKWIDARKRPVKMGMRFEVYQKESDAKIEKANYQQVADAAEIVIIGAGPAGYFAALQCLIVGLKPVIFDRGKDVQERRRDLRAIQQEGIVNPDSNYCFGEGGAGTYSDGKLYTRSNKKGNLKAVLQTLIDHGADPVIATDAHPHIGSNNLPKIIQSIRETIVSHGGEIHFNAKVTDFKTSFDQISAVQINSQIWKEAKQVILATGHSARDIYDIFLSKKWAISAKPFALGVRIEHPQSIIDKIQYGTSYRPSSLPAASYNLSCTIDKRGIFTFCMCPGGLIVPTATAPGEIVVNGMSLSKRNSPYSNSGIVVAIDPADVKDYGTELTACLEFQKHMERLAFEHGDGSQKAPAQRVTDLLNGKLSTDLPTTSYIPGLYSAEINEMLPPFLLKKMKAGLRRFGKTMKGYITEEAVVVGFESRTSAPFKIPRNIDNLQHPMIGGLYPCGEGAGYAGGIMSAALDGIRVVNTISQK